MKKNKGAVASLLGVAGWLKMLVVDLILFLLFIDCDLLLQNYCSLHGEPIHMPFRLPACAKSLVDSPCLLVAIDNLGEVIC